MFYIHSITPMILGFVIVILALGTSIGIMVYAQITPFIQTMRSINDSNKAYYAAQQAVETAMLVTRHQQPGFTGSGGRQELDSRGPLSDHRPPTVDTIPVLQHPKSLWHRSVDNQTMRIPQVEQGRIPTPREQESADYLPLYTQEIISISLSHRTQRGPTSYYTTDLREGPSEHQSIQAVFRLNPVLYREGHGELCLCDYDQDGIEDDILIARAIQGIYQDEFFRIIPRIDINNETNPASKGYADSYLRISDFTGYPPQAQLRREDNRHPLTERVENPRETYYQLLTGNNALSGKTFQSIRSDPNTSQLELQFVLIQPLLTQTKTRYPFIEWYVESTQHPLNDIYYRIEGNAGFQENTSHIQGVRPNTSHHSTGSFF